MIRPAETQYCDRCRRTVDAEQIRHCNFHYTNEGCKLMTQQEFRHEGEE
jgi:hypothetical protein